MASRLAVAVRLNEAFRVAALHSPDGQSAALVELKRVAEEYARERRAQNALLHDTLARISALHQLTFGMAPAFSHILECANACVIAVYAESPSNPIATPAEGTLAVGSPLVLLDYALRAYTHPPDDTDRSTALWRATILFTREQRRIGWPLHRVQQRLHTMARLSVLNAEELKRVLEWLNEWSAEVYRAGTSS